MFDEEWQDLPSLVFKRSDVRDDGMYLRQVKVDISSDITFKRLPLEYMKCRYARDDLRLLQSKGRYEGIDISNEPMTMIFSSSSIRFRQLFLSFLKIPFERLRFLKLKDTSIHILLTHKDQLDEAYIGILPLEKIFHWNVPAQLHALNSMSTVFDLYQRDPSLISPEYATAFFKQWNDLLENLLANIGSIINFQLIVEDVSSIRDLVSMLTMKFRNLPKEEWERTLYELSNQTDFKKLKLLVSDFSLSLARLQTQAFLRQCLTNETCREIAITFSHIYNCHLFQQEWRRWRDGFNKVVSK